MQTLIIDGYNVIYAIPEIENLLDESLEAARIGLVRLLSGFKGLRGDVENIVIVFDGKAGFFDEENTVSPGMKTIYTHGSKDADDKILEIIRDSNRPDLITVVSDDNFLHNNTRSLGARIKTVKEFYRMLK
jgi:ribosomal protection tetracycline resistance protein